MHSPGFARIGVATAGLVVAALTVLPAEKAGSAIPSHPDDKTIVHVLNRLGFGPVPGDIERVRRIGLDQYIDRQLHPERIPDTAMAERLTGFDSLTRTTRELAENYFIPAMQERKRVKEEAAVQPPDSGGDKRAMRTTAQVDAMQAERRVLGELTQQKVLRAAYSERQLAEVMVDFWFNHFNVFAGKGQVRLYLTEYERDTIRPHVFGSFRELLGATAQSPAMLFYLDNWQSSAPEGSPTAAPNRRALNPMRMRARASLRGPQVGTPMPGVVPPAAPPNRRPRGLNENYARELMELHTLGVDGGYTQKDVQEVARAFTGWTIANPREGGEFRFEPRMHDDGEKMVLGHRIAAGGGQHDAEQVLDILAAHPSTARFIATKLARRFVADEPPAALVDRAAARFRATNGDIREVVRTIVTSPEFFAADAYRAKVKTPFEFVASAVRASSSNVSNAQPLVQAMRDLGMAPYQCQPPTGYADRSEAWVNTGALLNRMNFAVSLTGGTLRGIRPTAGRTSADDSGRGSVEAARDLVIDQVLGGDLSAPTRSTVARATQPAQAVALLLGSPEFQRR
jgi:uncharacterized protein (DUF1800 family)